MCSGYDQRSGALLDPFEMEKGLRAELEGCDTEETQGVRSQIMSRQHLMAISPL